MTPKVFNLSPVFEKTYHHYLAELAGIDFAFVEKRLGIRIEERTAMIPFFNRKYRIDKNGVADMDGKKAPFDISVILLKYLMLCPKDPPTDKRWVAFREIKGAAPLIGYFSNEVEKVISKRFSGRFNALKKAAERLQGYPPENEFPYLFSARFDALPQIRLLMLFNDADDEFQAHCSVLFEKRSEAYLDPECLAIIGARLAGGLCLSADAFSEG